MNSIAIWYEQINDAEPQVPQLEIHINHWKLKVRMNYLKKQLRNVCTHTAGKLINKLSFNDSEYFMDIGLKVINGSSVKDVCLYIPHVFSEKKFVEDLGKRLRSIRMLTAVFNEPLTFNSNGHKYFEVQKNGEADFNVFELSVENDINIINVFGGTIIKFQHRQNGTIPTYYRFRLKGGFLNTLSLTYTPSNFLFESAYSKIEVIDFRINDTRNLDVSLIEHISKNKKFNLSLVHYFVMRNLKDDYILSNQKINSVRQLEKNTWSSYINESEYKYAGSFAYHLKAKVTSEDIQQNKYIDDFTAVLKFQFEDSKLIRYVLGFLLIALLIELGGNKAYDYFKDKYSVKETKQQVHDLSTTKDLQNLSKNASDTQKVWIVRDSSAKL